ncbi:hypothetical protein [Sphingomonas sp.]|uniref:hypothetical protein n=1 Tax=Sphingomonas sp. TaxID=28214 RepID=UPI0018570FAB|nr:hypothetical protein [Sphingomonas sp.]MBA3510659.1 hypothetical protein [Sphingomonas sp.]
MKVGTIALVTLLLAGCATARFHSEEELATVGRDCGLALGELFQDESEKRLVFLFKPGATIEQRACVVRWARKNRLKTVIVEAINFPEES